MLQIVVAILVAALVYWLCLVIGLPQIVAVVAALLVVLASFSDFGDRWR